MFKTYNLARGARVHILPDKRFRRTHVTCFLSGPLKADTASLVALVPPVLVRGTARHPKANLLEREMASLFGARMGAGVGKSGDRQMVRVGLNLSDEKYAGVPVLGPGLDFLKDILINPWLPEGVFSPEYVAQEQMQLVGRIRAIVNNKVRYAMLKGIQQIFEGEPAALSEEGTIEQVQKITPQSLLENYRWVIKEFPLDLYIVGDIDPDRAANLASEKLNLPDRTPLSLPKSVVSKGEGSMVRSWDKEPMEQGWIILGIKSGIPMGTEYRWILSMVNGVLGGYPHSKLFVNVREKASLAYGAGSFLDATKGTIFAYAGIDPKNYWKASDLMLEQLSAIAKGEFGLDELEATREAMITDMRLQLDSPGYLIHTHFTAQSEGAYEDVPSSIDAIKKVTKDQVVEIASLLRADTLFFLSGMDEKELPKA